MFMTGNEYRWNRVVLYCNTPPLHRDTRPGRTAIQERLGLALTNHINTGKDNAAGRGRSRLGALRGLRNIGPMFRGHMDLPRESAAGGAVGETRQTKRIVLNRKICIKPVLWNCMASETPDTLAGSRRQTGHGMGEHQQ